MKKYKIDALLIYEVEKGIEVEARTEKEAYYLAQKQLESDILIEMENDGTTAYAVYPRKIRVRAAKK